MAKLNTAPKSIHTHEGAKAKHISPEYELRRTVMACLLWENTFYESGEEIAKRIQTLVSKVSPEVAYDIAIEARDRMKLRHAPLLIAREMARLAPHKFLVKSLLSKIIQRADELAEMLAIYWKDGKQPVSGQVKKGLALAFRNFNEYQLAKYNRKHEIKFKDVLKICHPKAINDEQGALWKKVLDDTLEVPDTWEVALSAKDGISKTKKWERLLTENKLGALALLRNLRNMREEKVTESLIVKAIKDMKTEKILPFRFISAARYAPKLEPFLEEAMFKCLDGHEYIHRKTVLLVDVSGSMDNVLSAKSDMKRMDAACGLAMLLREICEDVSIYSFSNLLKEIPNRRGFALRDAIVSSQRHSNTYLGKAIKAISVDYDRLIVITDEQLSDPVSNPKSECDGYMINVAAYKNGVGYGPWLHIDGWSESVVDYIQYYEKEMKQ